MTMDQGSTDNPYPTRAPVGSLGGQTVWNPPRETRADVSVEQRMESSGGFPEIAVVMIEISKTCSELAYTFPPNHPRIRDLVILEKFPSGYFGN